MAFALPTKLPSCQPTSFLTFILLILSPIPLGGEVGASSCVGLSCCLGLNQTGNYINNKDSERLLLILNKSWEKYAAPGSG